MKFLLVAINAKYIHSNPAVYSLKAFAKEQRPKADIEIGEYTINHQMDRALGYLEKLVDLQDAQPEEPAKAQPTAQHVQKERERLPMTMEEILRMVRGNR